MHPGPSGSTLEAVPYSVHTCDHPVRSRILGTPMPAPAQCSPLLELGSRKALQVASGNLYNLAVVVHTAALLSPHVFCQAVSLAYCLPRLHQAMPFTVFFVTNSAIYVVLTQSHLV